MTTSTARRAGTACRGGARRLVVVGVIRRYRGRTFQIAATAAGATGRIQQQGGGQ